MGDNVLTRIRTILPVRGKSIELIQRQSGRFWAISLTAVLLVFTSLVAPPESTSAELDLQTLSDTEMTRVSARAGVDLAFKINVNSSGSSPSDYNFPGAHFVWRDNDNLQTGDSLDACENSWDCDDAYAIVDGLYGHIHLDEFAIDASSTSSQSFLQFDMGYTDTLDGYIRADAIGLGPGSNADCSVTTSCGNTLAGDVILEGPFDVTGEMRVWGN